MKSALILDLDNTILDTVAEGENIFGGLFEIINNNGEFSGTLEDIKAAVVRKPFQGVADKFKFSDHLREVGTKYLRTLTCHVPLSPFPDYEFVRSLQIEKYLVTAGFTTLQQSKIDKLGIEKDFNKVYIIDKEHSNMEKKDAFIDIMKSYHYKPEQLLVVGDDAESEIKAGKELGIMSVQYLHGKGRKGERIGNFSELAEFMR